MIKLKVPATTANLGPGFDCMGIALDLYNYIEIEEIDSGLKISIEDDNDRKKVDKDENNLVFKAVKKVFEKVGYRTKGLRIHIKYHIPIARGLGSSAACIVGGMMAANEICGRKLELHELMEMAVEMEGHPDNVVPAIVGSYVISAYTENKVEYLRLDLPEEIRFIIAVPDFELKTSDARRILPEMVSLKDAVFNISRAALLAAAVAEKRYNLFHFFGKDRLHQPYRGKLIPGMDQVMKNAVEEGALGVFLSGAGPSIIALSLKDFEKIGSKMKEIFFLNGIRSTILITGVSKKGAEILT